MAEKKISLQVPAQKNDFLFRQPLTEPGIRIAQAVFHPSGKIRQRVTQCRKITILRSASGDRNDIKVIGKF